ncbi:MAG: hypothetical protein H0X64_12965 [Gemmatimonadaceae bacterium]|nr:hypothetical protein [Gemmatimonadaceae bacterium]
MRSSISIAAPVIIPRALVLWGLTRLLLLLAALPLADGGSPGALSPPAIGIVLLIGLVGLVDVLARRERMLWANLGVTPGVLLACYAAAAVPGEAVIALVLR